VPSPAGLLGPDKPFVASMGIYVFSHDVLHEMLTRDRAVDFGREIIPHALSAYRVQPYLFRGFWADVGTVASFYDVNLMFARRGTPFSFFHPTRPIYTHPRFLPAARVHNCRINEALVAEGVYLDSCEIDTSIVGIRTTIQEGTRVTRSILLGADFYEDDGSDLPLGIGRDAQLDRVIVDKNARIGDGARLINDRGIQDADGDGYYIRNGIIIVPKGGVVKSGTVV
jgi:glucose-1-phosphate adenylyltransferase